MGEAVTASTSGERRAGRSPARWVLRWPTRRADSPGKLPGILLAVAFVAVSLCLSATALANLPDNRAYELVSPVEKGGRITMPQLAFPQANGEHVIVDGGVHNSLLSSGSSWMLETRTATGWSGTQIGPGPTPEASYQQQGAVSLDGVNEDFSSFAFQASMSYNPRLTGESRNIYVRNGPSGPFEWVTGPPAPMVEEQGPQQLNFAGYAENSLYGAIGNSVTMAGASTDLADVVWSQRLPLVSPPQSLPGSPVDDHEYGSEVYESAGAETQLVGLVPAAGAECGTSGGACVVPRCGAAMGNVSYASDATARGGSGPFTTVAGAVSGDGSQVVFMSPDPATSIETSALGCAPPGLYVREGATKTVEVSASQRTDCNYLRKRLEPGYVCTGAPEPDPAGPQPKWYAGTISDGGRIVAVLFTSQEELTDNANTGSQAYELADQRSDLYEYSMVTGKLTDLSADDQTGIFAEYLAASVKYFVGASSDGSYVYFVAQGELTEGAPFLGEKLYRYDASSGQLTYIADVGLEGAGADRFEVTPDGQVVFRDTKNLTSYNQEGNAEVYLYDPGDNQLTCVSCNPTGAPPVGPAVLPTRSPEGYDVEEPTTMPAAKAASDDGDRVFFESPDQLTPDAPTPSVGRLPIVESPVTEKFEPNLYEYEGGQLHLIAAAARLLTTTPSGNDVFLSTYSQLTPQDNDGSPDVYDARVGGGFPVPSGPVCSGSSCQGAPASAPLFATPPSVTFSGVGNFPAPQPAAGSTKTLKKQQKKTKPRGKHGKPKSHSRRSKRRSLHTPRRKS
jgi:hypothetical protein